MIREYYEKILSGDQVRANLIALREELKKEESRREFISMLDGDFSRLSALLEEEDPKVRKNAALILGQLESEDLLPVLFDAYEKEKTRFVRADYLKAIAKLDYQAYVTRLEAHLEELRNREPAAEERKHISEEIRMLQALILKYRRARRHRFTGQKVCTDMILVTNRCQREATARQLEKGKITLLAGGIRVSGLRVKDVLPIRTWSELLFPLERKMLWMQYPEAVGADTVLAMLELARTLHESDGPFPFRIELKSKSLAEKKGEYIRRVADALEKVSGGGLINSVADYELELRLLERKDGTFAAMLKVFTLPDKRFAYRREVVASSVSPVNAALAAELARPWLKEGAQILDPFCGVGTMLIERNQAVPAGIMYGVDIFGEAIRKARSNTDRAQCQIYYINKDFFAFEHSYRFDEVITDLPQVTATKQKEEIRALYHRFFEKLPEHLKEEAVLVLYTTELQLALEAMRTGAGYHLEKRFILNEKNQTAVLVVSWRKTDEKTDRR